jgi:hypothetical protein
MPFLENMPFLDGNKLHCSPGLMLMTVCINLVAWMNMFVRTVASPVVMDVLV